MGFWDSQFWDNLFQQCEGSSLNLVEPHSQGVQGCSRNVKDTLSCQPTWESVVTSNLFTISWAIMTNIYKHCVASWRQQSLGFSMGVLHPTRPARCPVVDWDISRWFSPRGFCWQCSMRKQLKWCQLFRQHYWWRGLDRMRIRKIYFLLLIVNDHTVKSNKQTKHQQEHPHQFPTASGHHHLYPFLSSNGSEFTGWWWMSHSKKNLSIGIIMSKDRKIKHVWNHNPDYQPIKAVSSFKTNYSRIQIWIH